MGFALFGDNACPCFSNWHMVPLGDVILCEVPIWHIWDAIWGRREISFFNIYNIMGLYLV